LEDVCAVYNGYQGVLAKFSWFQSIHSFICLFTRHLLSAYTLTAMTLSSEVKNMEKVFWVHLSLSEHRPWGAD
jgi:hypothetical protein